MKILIFLQGTILMAKNAAGLPREEIVRQVMEQEESVRDFANYIPIGNAAQKLQNWAGQGAEICYLTSLTENKKARGDEIIGKEGLKWDEEVLNRYGFPYGIIYHREASEKYSDVVARIIPPPDIFIEDDCESIGASEMTYPSLSEELQNRIKSILVREFGGIDHLPDDIRLLSE